MQCNGKVTNFSISQEEEKRERNKEKTRRERKQERHLVPSDFSNPSGAM